MADPITAFAGVSMVGGMMSAVGAQAAGQSAAAAQEVNAEIAGRNARLARESAAYDAKIQDQQARMTIGSMQAAFGASGVELEGSPLDVLQFSATQASRDNQMIKYRGELKALGYEDTRRFSLMGADSARTAGAFRSATELLTGFTGAGKLFVGGHTAPSAGTPVSTATR